MLVSTANQWAFWVRSQGTYRYGGFGFAVAEEEVDPVTGPEVRMLVVTLC